MNENSFILWCGGKEVWLDLEMDPHSFIDSGVTFSLILHIISQRKAAIATEKGEFPMKNITRLRVAPS